jgi:hypothetical protein
MRRKALAALDAMHHRPRRACVPVVEALEGTLQACVPVDGTLVWVRVLTFVGRRTLEAKRPAQAELESIRQR